MIKKILTTVMILTGLYSQAQDTLSYKYKLGGPSLSTQRVPLLSPLIYYGVGFTSDHGKYEQKGRSITSKSTLVDIGINTRQNLLIYSLGGSYIYNKQAILKGDLLPASFPQIAIGGYYEFAYGADIISDKRNNQSYFAVNKMLGFSFSLQKKLKKMVIYNDFSTPLLGLHWGSSYGSSFPYFLSEEDASFTDALHWGSVETCFQLRNSLSADFALKPKRNKAARTLRIKYTFDYKELNLNSTSHQSMFHGLTLGYVFSETPYLHTFNK